MGFNFVQQPTKEQQRIQDLENKVAKMDEFLELIGKAHLYDLWLDNQWTPEPEGEVVDFEELSLDDVASLENEK